MIEAPLTMFKKDENHSRFGNDFSRSFKKQEQLTLVNTSQTSEILATFQQIEEITY